MEFRWLTAEERRARSVESGSLSEVLALAQRLQAEGEVQVSEDQVVEMGRELGIQPEFVREALRLRRPAASSVRSPQPAPTLPPTDHNPIAAAGQVLLTVFALGMLPRTGDALSRSHHDPVLFFLFALVSALAAGWSARYSRLAGIAGALAVPVLLLVASSYPLYYHPGPALSGEAVFFSVLSLCPLCAATGRLAGRARRWAERFAQERPRLSLSRR
jgi:hypothetical protein